MQWNATPIVGLVIVHLLSAGAQASTLSVHLAVPPPSGDMHRSKPMRPSLDTASSDIFPRDRAHAHCTKVPPPSLELILRSDMGPGTLTIVLVHGSPGRPFPAFHDAIKYLG